MEENGRKWKEMGKSMVDVQIEGVFSKDPSKLRYKYRYRYKDPSKLRYRIQIQNEDRSHQGYRYKDPSKLRYRIYPSKYRYKI